jgi:hypothetical protein
MSEDRAKKHFWYFRDETVLSVHYDNTAGLGKIRFTLPNLATKQDRLSNLQRQQAEMDPQHKQSQQITGLAKAEEDRELIESLTQAAYSLTLVLHVEHLYFEIASFGESADTSPLQNQPGSN